MLKFSISEFPRWQIQCGRPNFKNLHILFETGFLRVSLVVKSESQVKIFGSHWLHCLLFSELHFDNFRYRSSDTKNLKKTFSRNFLGGNLCPPYCFRHIEFERFQ